MTNYTPGPWDLETIEDIIADVPEFGDNDETVAANARLIATAPDGHKLAEHIAAMADDAYLVGHPEWEAIVDEARALIARVEGARV